MGTFKHGLTENASSAYIGRKPRLVAYLSESKDNGAMQSTIGTVIVKRLKELNRTQAWLADAAEVSSTAVHLWIHKGEISTDKALVVAELLDVSMDELFGCESKNKREPRKPKMQLVWANEVELDLLTCFRNTDEMGRRLINMTAEGVPKNEMPPSETSRKD